MLIRNAGFLDGRHTDLRIENTRITEIGHLENRPQEFILDLQGATVLPGLHDHHIHLSASAAQRNSVFCGPPEVFTYDDLAKALQVSGTGWLRGIGFHESVTLGELPDAVTLDAIVSDRPLRIQHRSGRMWLLNTMALETLLSRLNAPEGLKRVNGRYSGHLFDEDTWLQQAMGSMPPDISACSLQLASFGVTGVTDMSPRNDNFIASHFNTQMKENRLLQSTVVAGSLSLNEVVGEPWLLGPVKLHLHEANLPDFDDTVQFIKLAHNMGRPVAVHCVSEVELVFTLALLEFAGILDGDRIEHVSVVSPDLITRMVEIGVKVCVQPHFIAERGDRYLLDVEAHHQPDLYRLQSLHKAGLKMAGGSDAPYGSLDPWLAMKAAVERKTHGGVIIGGDEALTPEQALSLYLADPLEISRKREITIGAPADLCLLDRPWAEARTTLDSSMVRATIASGALIYNRID